MKKQELFDKTVGILVKAYFGNTLEYSDCRACAIGNMIASNNDISIFRNEDNGFTCFGGNSGGWNDVIVLGEGKLIRESSRSEQSVTKLLSTGYSLIELAKIEERFYKGICHNDKWSDISDDINFNGMMAVVELLSEIHEATSEEAETAKQLFVI